MQQAKPPNCKKKLHVDAGTSGKAPKPSKAKGKNFFSSFVYGNNDKKLRQQQWDHLLSLSLPRDAPWFLTGDLNDILCNDEKDGGVVRPKGSFSDLRTFFSEGDLFDLQHSGDPLFWRGQRGDDLVKCRLDRAASNTLWAECFPTARCQYLEFESSDHRPLISFFDKGGKRKRGLFRYDRRLCNNEEAKKFIDETLRDDTREAVCDILANTRSAISLWNKTQQRNSKKQIEQKKLELDVALSSPQNDTNLIQDIKTKLNAAYLAEEEYWKQRSRLLWLKLGDRNTGYFHAITKSRKRANAFSVLENDDGQMVNKEEEIVQVIGDYFQHLFTSTPGEREMIVNQALCPIISEAENELLLSVPSATEIKEAAWSINAEKAPGPDGFSAGFFHTHWNRIGTAVVREVQEFFSGAPLPDTINHTHVRLIPKVSKPQKVSEYRPIALCNVYYKIYSKIITRRLQPLMEKLISENQSAFVPGRAIGDNVLITHEVLHYLKSSKAEQRCAMAIKTDMSKAYDRLEWDFISLVLLRYIILINGLPRGMVVPSRGIRQGDPLSPYIFIMCSEVLSGLCNRAQELGTLQGLRVARGCPRVSHLLFADDTMFFLNANKGNCQALKTILSSYEQASGQSINKDKSAITFSRKAPAELKEMIKNELEISKEGELGNIWVSRSNLDGERETSSLLSSTGSNKRRKGGLTNSFPQQGS
ncbi:uncharacterized protein LOC130496777 [Raphanus sativus]|uniref:Uncharacterized protein LOC130496777 n=1 Tax=Raphanus sativus TaxID=3726 RepID=A0A9W3C126_RAPSA|nr:uncharacterized protein LOC130496777 [Raphanus sativus]